MACGRHVLDDFCSSDAATAGVACGEEARRSALDVGVRGVSGSAGDGVLAGDSSCRRASTCARTGTSSAVSACARGAAGRRSIQPPHDHGDRRARDRRQCARGARDCRSSRGGALAWAAAASAGSAGALAGGGLAGRGAWPAAGAWSRGRRHGRRRRCARRGRGRRVGAAGLPRGPDPELLPIAAARDRRRELHALEAR